jgi:hypothetical protein
MAGNTRIAHLLCQEAHANGLVRAGIAADVFGSLPDVYTGTRFRDNPIACVIQEYQRAGGQEHGRMP